MNLSELLKSEIATEVRAGPREDAARPQVEIAANFSAAILRETVREYTEQGDQWLSELVYFWLSRNYNDVTAKMRSAGAPGE